MNYILVVMLGLGSHAIEQVSFAQFRSKAACQEAADHINRFAPGTVVVQEPMPLEVKAATCFPAK